MKIRAAKCNSVSRLVIALFLTPTVVWGATLPDAETSEDGEEIVNDGILADGSSVWPGFQDKLRALCLLVPCPLNPVAPSPTKESIEEQMQDRIDAYLAGGIRPGLSIIEKQMGLLTISEMQALLAQPPENADAELVQELKQTLAMMQFELLLP